MTWCLINIKNLGGDKCSTQFVVLFWQLRMHTMLLESIHPISGLKTHMIEIILASEVELEAIEKKLYQVVNDAMEFAVEGPIRLFLPTVSSQRMCFRIQKVLELDLTGDIYLRIQNSLKALLMRNLSSFGHHTIYLHWHSVYGCMVVM